jgi:hypothetical protein
VLLCACGRDADHSVCMIRGANQNGVNILVVNQRSIVVVLFYAIKWFTVALRIIFIHKSFPFGCAFCIYITHGNYLCEILFPDARHIVGA